MCTNMERYYEYFPVTKEEAPGTRTIHINTSIPTLEEECARCASVLDKDEPLRNIKRLDWSLCFATENLLLTQGVDVRGLAAKVKVEHAESNGPLERELRELAIEYEPWLRFGPHMRYVGGFIGRISKIMEDHKATNANYTPNTEKYAHL